jgi:hypothetical protein
MALQINYKRAVNKTKTVPVIMPDGRVKRVIRSTRNTAIIDAYVKEYYDLQARLIGVDLDTWTRIVDRMRYIDDKVYHLENPTHTCDPVETKSYNPYIRKTLLTQ